MSREVRVALQAWLLGTGPSGANRRLVELAAAASELADLRLLLLGDPARNPFPEALPRAVAWHQVPIPAAPTLRRAIAERRALPGLLRALGCDVLAAATLPAPPTGPLPLCLTIHDVRDATAFGRHGRRWWFRRLLCSAAARATALIVPSRYTAEQVRRLTGCTPQKLHVIANGVGDRFFAAPAAPRDLLLHVGHLLPHKNLELLLRAYARARQRRELPPLWFAGSGSRRESRRLADLAQRLGLGGSVRWLGRVADPELPSLHARALAVLVPSLHEGFGIPVLEGMAAGACVLAANGSALPEVAGEAGILLPPHDVEAWAAAIAEVCADRTANRQRRDAGVAWARRFRWRDIAAAEVAVWRRCAARGP